MPGGEVVMYIWEGAKAPKRLFQQFKIIYHYFYLPGRYIFIYCLCRTCLNDSLHSNNIFSINMFDSIQNGLR